MNDEYNINDEYKIIDLHEKDEYNTVKKYLIDRTVIEVTSNFFTSIHPHNSGFISCVATDKESGEIYWFYGVKLEKVQNKQDNVNE